MNQNWVWHLVVDETGDVKEAFNSLYGAERWAEDHGGYVVKVKEVQNNE